MCHLSRHCQFPVAYYQALGSSTDCSIWQPGNIMLQLQRCQYRSVTTTLEPSLSLHIQESLRGGQIYVDDPLSQWLTIQTRKHGHHRGVDSDTVHGFHSLQKYHRHLRSDLRYAPMTAVLADCPFKHALSQQCSIFCPLTLCSVWLLPMAPARG